MKLDYVLKKCGAVSGLTYFLRQIQSLYMPLGKCISIFIILISDFEIVLFGFVTTLFYFFILDSVREKVESLWASWQDETGEQSQVVCPLKLSAKGGSLSEVGIRCEGGNGIHSSQFFS